MNKKRVYKVLAAFLISSTLISSINADCMPVLVVVRHAEDNNSGLDEHGWAHAAAYGHLFKLFASTDKYPRLNDLMNNGTLCPFKSIVSYYTGKPKQTAESIRDNLDLSGYEIWGSDSKPNINIPERKAGISTILIMNRQSLWGEGGKPDKGTFLDRAIPYGSERDKIIKAGSPMFNYMYVFTYQNNTTLNNVSIFAQKYNYSGRTNQCNVRLHDGSVNNPIIISHLAPMPEYGIFQAPSSWGCTTE